MGAEDGEVGVVALEILVGVAVHHRQVIIIVLLADKAAGILAEGTDLVLKGLGIAHQLGFIQHPVHGLHDLVADFHPDADIHSAGSVGNAVLRAELFQPVSTPAAGGHHRVLCINLQIVLAVGDGHALAHFIFQNDVAALVTEVHLHAVFLEIALNGQIDGLGLLRTHVADGAVHQLEARLDGALADLLALFLVLQALDMGVCAKLQIDLVCIVDGLLGQFRTDEVRQIAAHLIAQRELAVRESTGTGKTGGNVAVGFAVHALVGLVLGAVALFHALSLFHHNDLLLAALFDHLQGGENSGRAGADDDNICVHCSILLMFSLFCR